MAGVHAAAASFPVRSGHAASNISAIGMSGVKMVVDVENNTYISEQNKKIGRLTCAVLAKMSVEYHYSGRLFNVECGFYCGVMFLTCGLRHGLG